MEGKEEVLSFQDPPSILGTFLLLKVAVFLGAGLQQFSFFFFFSFLFFFFFFFHLVSFPALCACLSGFVKAFLDI
jgi:hypothetical protein